MATCSKCGKQLDVPQWGEVICADCVKKKNGLIYPESVCLVELLGHDIEDQPEPLTVTSSHIRAQKFIIEQAEKKVAEYTSWEHVKDVRLVKSDEDINEVEYKNLQLIRGNPRSRLNSEYFNRPLSVKDYTEQLVTFHVMYLLKVPNRTTPHRTWDWITYHDLYQSVVLPVY